MAARVTVKLLNYSGILVGFRQERQILSLIKRKEAEWSAYPTTARLTHRSAAELSEFERQQESRSTQLRIDLEAGETDRLCECTGLVNGKRAPMREHMRLGAAINGKSHNTDRPDQHMYPRPRDRRY